jgi:hypothetical protein
MTASVSFPTQVASAILLSSLWCVRPALATEPPLMNFTARTSSSGGSFPFSLASGDFNHDGRLDLAVVNRAVAAWEWRGQTETFGLTVLLGRGDGTFEAARNYEAGARPCPMIVGDFNGDGQPDLAVGNNTEQGTITVPPEHFCLRCS